MVGKVQSLQRDSSDLQNLHYQHAKMIDEALGEIGDFGEIRLIVEKGRLRFLVTQKSYDALKYRPGAINTDTR
ncbi:MAG: hypothetical protein U9Q82_00420 [Chloroflexota bacterium]|nr:hypothetical protein [Chloroflexota bacterium]